MAAKGKREWWQALGFGLLVAGTLLSHYLTAFLLALYLIIIGVEWLIQSLQNEAVGLEKHFTFGYPPLGFGFLFSFRWYIRIFRYSASFVSTSAFVPGEFKLDQGQLDYLRYILGPKVAYWLLGLALAGLVWAMFKLEWRKLAIWSVCWLFSRSRSGSGSLASAVIIMPDALYSSGLFERGLSHLGL